MSEEQDFNFICPNCQAELTGVPDLIGQEVACPVCGKSITVPAPEKKEKAAEAAGIPELRTKALPSALRKPPKPKAEEPENKNVPPPPPEDNGDFLLKGGTRPSRRSAAPAAKPTAAKEAAAPVDAIRQSPFAETPVQPSERSGDKNAPTMKLPPVLPPKYLRNDPNFYWKKLSLIGILSFSGVFLIMLLLCLLFRGCGK